MKCSPKYFSTGFRFIYKSAFGKYLLATNVISSGILMGLGDAAEQIIELKTKIHPTGEFDWKRIRNMTLVGLMVGLPQHYFYKHLDFQLPATDKKTVFKKIFFDQTIASPGSIFIFFFGLGLIEHGNFTAGYTELSQKFTTVYMMDWLFWPPTQFINFLYLPARYRVIYVNGMTMLYDVFLSYMKFIHKSAIIDDEQNKEGGELFVSS